MVSGVKCGICAAVFHPSCAKNSAYVKISDDIVKCCEKTYENQMDDEFEDALDFDELPKHFKYILRQKDIIIAELREKNEILKDQVKLYKTFSRLQLDDLEGDKQQVEKNKLDDKQCTPQNQVHAKNPNKQRTADQMPKMTNPNHTTKQKQIKQINTPDIRNADTDNSRKESEWNEVRIRQRKSSQRVPQVVGTNTQFPSIKVAPKKAFIYVSRLAPGTSAAEVCGLLKSKFPETTCQELDSKHPEFYTSFKVTVDLHNFNSALDANNWPSGCYVTRYFHRATTRQTPS